MDGQISLFDQEVDNSTSTAAYLQVLAEGLVGKREAQVLDTLAKHGEKVLQEAKACSDLKCAGAVTPPELCESHKQSAALSASEVSMQIEGERSDRSITPRFKQLENRNAIERVTKRTCLITGRTVWTYIVTGVINPKSDSALKPNKSHIAGFNAAILSLREENHTEIADKLEQIKEDSIIHYLIEEKRLSKERSKFKEEENPDQISIFPSLNKKKFGFYETRAWLQLRYAVLKKYGRICMKCGATEGEMHVDHIKPRSLYPELELVFDNLQVLCRECNLGKGNSDCIDWRETN